MKRYVEIRSNKFRTIRSKKEKDSFGKTFAEGLMKPIFGDEPHRDLFRAVKVSDSIPDKTPEPKIIKVVCINTAAIAYYSTQPNRRDRDITIPCECLPPGTSAGFSIKLDKNILNYWEKEHQKAAPFSNVEELLQIARDFAAAQWHFETTFLHNAHSGVDLSQLRRFYAGEARASLRLGWGTGLMGTTIDLLIGDSLRQKIRYIASDQNIPGAAPKSRRVMVDQNVPIHSLGWVKLAIRK